MDLTLKQLGYNMDGGMRHVIASKQVWRDSHARLENEGRTLTLE